MSTVLQSILDQNASFYVEFSLCGIVFQFFRNFFGGLIFRNTVVSHVLILLVQADPDPDGSNHFPTWYQLTSHTGTSTFRLTLYSETVAATDSAPGC